MTTVTRRSDGGGDNAPISHLCTMSLNDYSWKNSHIILFYFIMYSISLFCNISEFDEELFISRLNILRTYCQITIWNIIIFVVLLILLALLTIFIVILVNVVKLHKYSLVFHRICNILVILSNLKVIQSLYHIP